MVNGQKVKLSDAERRERRREYHRKYREANREKIRAYQHKWYEDNRDELLDRQREYYGSNNERQRERRRKYREFNLDKERERHRKYREANAERIREYSRNHYESNYEKYRERKLFRKYGLTSQEVRDLDKLQAGLCAICGKRETLLVDHDHVTGRVRGLLCNPCNKMLGFAKDMPSTLRSGADYIDSHK